MERRTVSVVGGPGPQRRGLAYRFEGVGHVVTLGSREANCTASTNFMPMF